MRVLHYFAPLAGAGLLSAAMFPAPALATPTTPFLDNWRTVEALAARSGTWSFWPSLKPGRHGSGLAQLNGSIYVAASGGSPELESTEASLLFPKP